MDQRVTQKDLAKHLGLGQETVSLAFRHPEKLKPETVRKILAAARQLGYRPNSSARAMRRGRHDNVLLVQPTAGMFGSLHAGMLNGIIAGLEPANVSLSVASAGAESMQGADYIPKALREFGADGILLAYDNAIPPTMVEQIRNQGLPVVWINSKQPADCVHPDDDAAAHAVTTHLLQLGHRRIAYCDFFVNLIRAVHYSRHDRLAGYTRAMLEARLEPIICCPAENWRHEQLVDLAADWLAVNRPTAVVTYSTTEAAAVIRAADTRLHLAIPEELSLAAIVDGNPYLGLRLTAMQLPHFETGRTAAAMLLRKLTTAAGELPPVTVPCRFINAAASAAPPKSSIS